MYSVYDKDGQYQAMQEQMDEVTQKSEAAEKERNDKTAFEYAQMLAESGDSISAQQVLAGIIQRNPDYNKAAALADSLRQKADAEPQDK